MIVMVFPLRKVVLKVQISIIFCRHRLKIMWDEQVMFVDSVMCQLYGNLQIMTVNVY